MAIEHIQVTEFAAKAGARGTYYKIGKLYCFEPKVSAELQNLVGQTVAVDVDRTPNAEGKVFPKIESFHGVVADGTPAPAAPAATSPASTPSANAGRPAGGGGDFKKDPVGIILEARKTALGCATALAKEHATNLDETQIAAWVAITAEPLAEWLLKGLSPFILRDGVQVSNVLPWRADLRKAANEAAKAKLPEPPPPEPAVGPAGVADDDIPF